MKNKLWNVVILLGGAFIFLTAHYYQSDTDQVSVKHTIFPGKTSYLYAPDYPKYKRLGYRSGDNWYYHDYSNFTADSAPLFNKSIVAVYDVTNKTKNYLLVPVNFSYETPGSSTSSDASYTVIGLADNLKYSIVEYFLLDPKETMKGMYTFSNPPLNLNIQPQAATVVDKKWVQGLQQAMDGDKKKLDQYLLDTLAMPAAVKLKDKLSDVTQPDLIKNISFTYKSMRPNKSTYSHPIEFSVEAVNNNLYKVQTTITADCFATSNSMLMLPGETKTMWVGVDRKAGCDTLNPKFSVSKVRILDIKK